MVNMKYHVLYFWPLFLVLEISSQSLLQLIVESYIPLTPFFPDFIIFILQMSFDGAKAGLNGFTILPSNVFPELTEMKCEKCSKYLKPYST